MSFEPLYQRCANNYENKETHHKANNDQNKTAKTTY